MTSPNHSRDVQALFLLPAQLTALLADSARLEAATPDWISRLSKNFRSNLQGAITTGCMPIYLAVMHALDAYRQRVSIAERIRVIPLPGDADFSPQPDTLAPEKAALAATNADREVSEFLASDNALSALTRDGFRFLSVVSRREDITAAAEELLRQVSVLTWAAFEVLARDLFAEYLNTHPDRAQALFHHPATQRRFSRRLFDLDALVRFDFDLSHSVGDLLSEGCEFSRLQTTRDLYLALFGQDDDLVTALSSKVLWILNQRRHLIVHNRAIVDEKCVLQTGETIPTGGRLLVTPQDVESYFRAVIGTGSTLLAAASKHVS